MSTFKRISRLLITLTALSLGPAIASADADAQVSKDEGWRVSLETDPLDYVLSGYGAVVGVRTPWLPQWRFTLATFGLDLPEFLVNMGSDNDGYGLRIRNGTGVQANYHFSEQGSSWFVGPSISTIAFRYTHQDAPGERADVRKLLVAAQGGYQWFPLKDRGFYLLPWMNAAVALAHSGEPVVAGREFVELPVAVNLLFHIGYEFQ